MPERAISEIWFRVRVASGLHRTRRGDALCGAENKAEEDRNGGDPGGAEERWAWLDLGRAGAARAHCRGAAARPSRLRGPARERRRCGRAVGRAGSTRAGVTRTPPGGMTMARKKD